MWVYRADAYIAGFFLGCMALCMLMLAVPKPTSCQVKMYYDGGRVEVVRFGVVNTF